MTFIVVPHGDLETRTLEISYRRLKVALGVAGAGFLLVLGIISSWWYVAAQAARVPDLEREMARLQTERAQVTELARTLATVEGQYARVRALLGADVAARGRDVWLPPLDSEGVDEAPAAPASSLPDSWPLAQSGYITRELTGDEGGRHPGLDIAVPQDSYIRAAGAGIVRDAGRDEVYGYYVLLEHADGYTSMYGHASRLFVAAGDTVSRHSVIALSGSTGRSTAPHLHFEIRKDGEPVDPLTLVHQP